VVCKCMLDLQESKDHGKNKGIDVGSVVILFSEIDERRLKVAVPEEPIVRAFPEGR